MDAKTAEWLRYLTPKERGEAVALLMQQASDEAYQGPEVDPDDALSHLEKPLADV